MMSARVRSRFPVARMVRSARAFWQARSGHGAAACDSSRGKRLRGERISLHECQYSCRRSPRIRRRSRQSFYLMACRSRLATVFASLNWQEHCVSSRAMGARTLHGGELGRRCAEYFLGKGGRSAVLLKDQTLLVET